MTPMSSTRELFGGAITATLPSNLVDASDFRQVPDTQELLLFPNSNASMILEVLEQVAQDDLAEAAKFHFSSIAHDNDATSSTVHAVEILPSPESSGPSPTILTGRQTVAKYNCTTPDEVEILLALFRIAEKNVDLVLSFNVPTAIANGEGAIGEAGQERVRVVFDEAVRSLKIVDLGLFA